MIDYNRRMVDRLHEEWLNPFDDVTESETCLCCYGLANYEIEGRFFCESCAKDEFVDYADDEAECELCGASVDTCYRVKGDTYCEGCFDREFRI